MQLGLPECSEALWCYVAKPIHWDRLYNILARLFPGPPPRQGVPGSDREDSSSAIRHPPQDLREQLRQLRQPAQARSA
jgi:hypothetical protein